MAKLQLKKLNIHYDDFHAVKDVDLEIDDSEIVTLLGPSGCGKTSILRAIAGFVQPSSGDVVLNDDTITDLPPQKRDMGMIFQNYALWPHMKVSGNIDYGLRLRNVEEKPREQRVDQLLEQVQLLDQKGKLPTQLSGGQQQRVALARALAVDPKVLLCDEPLSNLDFKLRVELRKEIRNIAKNFDVTVVYVTHDQTEALAISDKIAVINFGEVIQVGTPLEIFNNPNSHFVGRFVGENNLLSGKIVSNASDHVMVELPDGNTFRVDNLKDEVSEGLEVDIIIRYDQITISDQDQAIEGTLQYSAYMGNYLQVDIALGDDTVFSANIVDDIERIAGLDKGKEISARFNPDKIFLFKKDGTRIY